MQDHQPKRRLSEISHLFLSDIREGSNAAKPQRIPPKANVVQQPVTPPTGPSQEQAVAKLNGDPTSVVSAVLVAHLNGRTDAVVREYAAHLSRDGSRIGVATVGPRAISLAVVEPGDVGTSTPADRSPTVDARQLGEAMIELDADVDRWLIVLPDTRSPGTQGVLEAARHWTLLSTDDHDGIVGAYRTLKSVAEGIKPQRLQVAVIEGRNPEAARGSLSKLKQVVEQFLGWPVVTEPPARPSPLAGCRVVLTGRPTGKGEAYDTLISFLEASREIEPMMPIMKSIDLPHEPMVDRGNQPSFDPAISAAQLEAEHHSHEAFDDESAAESEDELLFQVTEDAVTHAISEGPAKPHNEPVRAPAPATATAPAAIAPPPVAAAPRPAPAPVFPSAMPEVRPVDLRNSNDDVIDLPAGASVVQAVAATRRDLIATPVSLPDWPGALLAVSRSGVLTVMASVGTASDLAKASAARAWLTSHHALLSMAMPQMTLASGADVQLLIDTRGELGSVPSIDGATIVRYRHINWAGKSGLMLL